ncbi:receptor-like protein kinase 7 [Quercus lobata]|uniref:receptor-like protein kinase 7 n=1 Tax=Quercus lobata TaxID=97700 RepID=UPI0012493AA2|nr:receptor-like protein kinase 7 [Quercus lobata]
MIKVKALGNLTSTKKPTRLRKVASMSRPLLYPFYLLFCFFSLLSGIQSDDLQILMKLKSTLLQTSNTTAFISWESSNSMCNFTGINCNSGGFVTEIELSYQNLTGILPLDSICQLQSLEKLSFGFNYLHGPTMDDLKNCVKLQYLDLGNNLFTGWSVPEISSLSQLRYLHLNASGFSGTFPWKSLQNMTGLVRLSLGDNPFKPSPFPNEVLLLTNLTWLYLSNCGIQGTIPAEIGNLKELINLELADNNMTGEIPVEIGNLVNLWQLELYNNSLTGKLPIGLRNLTKLEMFDSSRNYLEGDLSELRFLNNLVSLHLFENELSGQVPAEFGKFTKLENFSLYGNNFIGPLPPNLGSWAKINYIDIAANFFTGPIPPDMCKQGTMKWLFMFENYLTGEIPASYANCSTLRRFMVNNNSLSGEVPIGIWGLPNRNLIDISLNDIEGPITSDIKNAKSLTYLFAGNNRLSGELPAAICNVLVLKSNKFHGPIGNHNTSGVFFFKLRILDLSHNEFTGLLPRNYFENFNAMMINDECRLEPHYMGESVQYYMFQSVQNQDSVVLTVKGLEIKLQRILTTFTTIDLSSNKFQGVIPEVLGRLTILRLLNLSHNSLTGHIPSSLAKLSALESLDLSSNSLTGEIPLQLIDLTFLAMLNLSQNQLIGPIPQGKQFATFENNSYDGNLGLCGFPLSIKCSTNKLMPPLLASIFQEDNNYSFARGFGWKAVLIGYGCGFLFGLVMGYVVFKIGKPQWLFMDMLLKSSIFNAPTGNSSVKSLFDSVSLYLVPSNKQMRMPMKILQRNNQYPFRLALNCVGRCGIRNFFNSRYREVVGRADLEFVELIKRGIVLAAMICGVLVFGCKRVFAMEGAVNAGYGVIGQSIRY